jgi:HEAT repeat protein
MRVMRKFSIAFTACSLLSTSLVHAVPPASTAPAAAKSGQAAVVLAATEGTAPAALSGPVRAEPRSMSVGREADAHGVSREEYARRLQGATVALRSSDPDAIQRALVSLKELSGRAAADVIVARVQAGLPPQLTEQALVVLGGLGQPIAAPVLSELTLHRRWQIRAEAVRALGGLRVRSSVSVLLYALDDPSAEVRRAAALALGMAGDPRAIPALNAALLRNADGALEGLAQLVPSKQVDAILARAKLNLTASEPALWLLLARPNLPAVTKLKVISFVQAHDSEGEAQQIVALWKTKLKESGDLRLLGALTSSAAAAPRTAAKPGQASATVVPVASQGGQP